MTRQVLVDAAALEKVLENHKESRFPYTGGMGIDYAGEYEVCTSCFEVMPGMHAKGCPVPALQAALAQAETRANVIEFDKYQPNPNLEPSLDDVLELLAEIEAEASRTEAYSNATQNESTDDWDFAQGQRNVIERIRALITPTESPAESPAESPDEQEHVLKQATEQLAQGPLWLHKKGNVYVELERTIGRHGAAGEMCAYKNGVGSQTTYPVLTDDVRDGEEVVIYRLLDDHQLYIRPARLFDDGRFTRLTLAPVAQPVASAQAKEE